MADNFLERHREEYEQRKAAWLKKKRHLPKKAAKNVAQTINRPKDEALYKYRHMSLFYSYLVFLQHVEAMRNMSTIIIRCNLNSHCGANIKKRQESPVSLLI